MKKDLKLSIAKSNLWQCAIIGHLTSEVLVGQENQILGKRRPGGLGGPNTRYGKSR